MNAVSKVVEFTEDRRIRTVYVLRPKSFIGKPLLSYVGSTGQSLVIRLNSHRSAARSGKNSKLYTKMREIGIDDNWEITPLLVVPNCTWTEIRRFEDEWIKLLSPSLNTKAAFQTYEERLEKDRKQKRQNYADDPEKYRKQKRQSYADDPEKYRERRRQWCADNPEKRREVDRKYREANLEKVRDRDRQYKNRHRLFQKEFFRLVHLPDI